MTQMTKKEIKGITEDIFEALKKIEEKHGVTIKQKGNITYSSIDFNLKLKVETSNEDALIAKAKEEFEHFARLYEFNPNGFRVPFTFENKEMRIVGYSASSRKYPFIAEVLGKDVRYKLTKGIYNKAFPM